VRGLLLGVLLMVLVQAVAIYLVVQNGWIDPRADDGYMPMEKWASRVVPRAIRSDSQGLNSPIEATSENLAAGAKLYGANCAMCHGASDAKESNVAKGLYIKAPQLAKDGVEDDPVGQTYFKIAHGYRMTPMPAFSKSLSETQIWQLALFLKNMDKLPPLVEAEFKKIPSQATP
jgi:mono/diheme cytochrome c family protein